MSEARELVERLVEALAPFASEADGRRNKGLNGAVCFTQPTLIDARTAITDARAWLEKEGAK